MFFVVVVVVCCFFSNNNSENFASQPSFSEVLAVFFPYFYKIVLQFLQPFPSILLSVELFLAHIYILDFFNECANWKFRFKLLIYQFSGENGKSLGSI